jgi:hypothetical protein
MRIVVVNLANHAEAGKLACRHRLRDDNAASSKEFEHL